MKRIVIGLLVVVLAFPSYALSRRVKRKAEKSSPSAAQSQVNTKGGKIAGEMVLVSGGDFWMGLHEDLISKASELAQGKIEKSIVEETLRAEMPRHRVVIAPFYIDKYEVTNDEFARFVKEAHYKPEGGWSMQYEADMRDNPAVGVTWNDASAYAQWAGKRLPTEAEWEFAARGGADDRLFPWGDDISADMANYALKEERVSVRIKTVEVGSYQPNSFGIYDVIGNAAEWCADWYGRDYYSKSSEMNPEGPVDGKEKVIRGGGWMTPPFFCIISCRGAMKPGSSNQQIGFRCARSLNP